jgi:ABC-type antimicrobial peptide transport system permease subunit
VVGVAADVHRSGVHEEPSLAYYVPLGQEAGFTGTWLLIRPARSATASWPALRNALLIADPAITALDLHMLSESLETELRPFRLGVAMFTASAALALIVAALGLYSLMAYTVSWRTREIGVRIALGATGSMITKRVVSAGATLATIGIAAGLLIVIAARPWLQSQLFETSATDPLVLGAVAIAMQLVAAAACWIPARRAGRVSPVEALKSS